MKILSGISNKKELVGSKQTDVIDFIKTQINVDISDHIEPRFSNKKMITIWIDELPNNDLVNIERLANKFKKFTIVPNGRDKMAIIFKK